MQPGELSPDRLWRWDGASWVPTGGTLPPPPAGAWAASAGETRPVSWSAIAGGITALVAGVLILVACALPYIHYTDSTSPSSISIFYTGFAPSNAFAIEPVGIAVLALVAGVVLMAWMSRLPRAVAAGILIAAGAQTFLLFAGYVLFTAGSSSAQHGAGGFVGLLAGLLLFAGGVTAAVSLFSYRSTSAS
jgi:hypothetical protein